MADNLFYNKTARVRIDLNKKDFQKNVKKMADLDKVWNRVVEKALLDFSKRLAQKLNENLELVGLGHLSGTVQMSVNSNGLELWFGNPEYTGAMFLEYGTGRAGATAPHPKAGAFWQYESGQYIQSDGNWWYTVRAGSEPYPNQATFMSKQGNLMARTANQGQVGKQFVYRTWLWGTRSIKQMIYANIKRQLHQIYGG